MTYQEIRSELLAISEEYRRTKVPPDFGRIQVLYRGLRALGIDQRSVGLNRRALGFSPRQVRTGRECAAGKLCRKVCRCSPNIPELA